MKTVKYIFENGASIEVAAGVIFQDFADAVMDMIVDNGEVVDIQFV